MYSSWLHAAAVSRDALLILTKSRHVVRLDWPHAILISQPLNDLYRVIVVNPSAGTTLDIIGNFLDSVMPYKCRDMIFATLTTQVRLCRFQVLLA